MLGNQCRTAPDVVKWHRYKEGVSNFYVRKVSFVVVLRQLGFVGFSVMSYNRVSRFLVALV